MSNRLATRIGLLVAEERPSDARDVVRFREPTVGAEARSKGSLFLLAQLTGGGAALARVTREVLAALEQDYYYDLSAGTVGVLAKALANANRRFYHARGKLGIPRRAGVSVIAVAVQTRHEIPDPPLALSWLARRPSVSHPLIKLEFPGPPARIDLVAVSGRQSRL